MKKILSVVCAGLLVCGTQASAMKNNQENSVQENSVQEDSTQEEASVPKQIALVSGLIAVEALCCLGQYYVARRLMSPIPVTTNGFWGSTTTHVYPSLLKQGFWYAIQVGMSFASFIGILLSGLLLEEYLGEANAASAGLSSAIIYGASVASGITNALAMQTNGTSFVGKALLGTAASLAPRIIMVRSAA